MNVQKSILRSETCPAWSFYPEMICHTCYCEKKWYVRARAPPRARAGHTKLPEYVSWAQMIISAKNPKSLSSKLRPWTPLSVDEPFWTCVRARPAKKRACKQHRLFKNQFEGQKRVQHGHFTQKWYVTHATVKKNGMCARAHHRARARDMRNRLNKLVEHKWWPLQKTRSLYLQNCDREPPPPTCFHEWDIPFGSISDNYILQVLIFRDDGWSLNPWFLENEILSLIPGKFKVKLGQFSRTENVY